jgi:hypothetical protein
VYENGSDKNKGNLIYAATDMPENNLLILNVFQFFSVLECTFFVQHAQFSVHIIENEIERFNEVVFQDPICHRFG